MAFRITSQLRSVGNQLAGGRRFATAVTGNAKSAYNKFSVTGEFAPIAVVGGLTFIAVAMAGHSCKQQLAHSPTVSARKRRREAMAEVDDPDRVIESADKFITKSWLRKIGQIQDKSKAVLSDPTRPDPYTTPRNAETLKSVGVKPRGI
ncbi:PREDICTED: uncharacterized protein LOC104823574 [Tarenaya hassleriana]|uniref:uncharacterized protein LOC104823574 n=1 Tax=Tarenaya hassleriana TaxID=28532 RepID=UPI00053C26CD|nr:PREDICTED: uncharacterized protein LOC104823574 [Tarenaya hassleriana]